MLYNPAETDFQKYGGETEEALLIISRRRSTV
jgi:hypothetical protein